MLSACSNALEVIVDELPDLTVKGVNEKRLSLPYLAQKVHVSDRADVIE